MQHPNAQSQHYWRIQLWLLLACLAFFALLTRGNFQSTDEIAVFQQARSLWERGELDVVPMLNTRVGPDGRSYAPYGIGQSLAAAPLYGAGKWLRERLADRKDWARTLSGPYIGDAAIRWGGEVEIFTVGLFGAFVTACLCVLFFGFSVEVGASIRSALISTMLLATSSYIVGFSNTFFQHSFETLIVFWCFYLLFADAVHPSWLRRCAAGALAGYAILVRPQTLILVPAFSAYLFWNAWCRHRSTVPFGARLLRKCMREYAPFLGFVGLGIVMQFLVSYEKFGERSFSGAYGGQRFDEPLTTTLYGFLFSPGKSMFIFTPLLILAPAYWPPFVRRHRATALCVLVASFSYLLFFAKYEIWHGAWCLGPRYLVATVPLLLLPFAAWWDRASIARRAAAILLGLLGVFVQLLHVAVNFSYVWHWEKYESFQPRLGYLFIPESSPLAAFYRALMAGDHRVDMWLVDIYREFGLTRLLVVSLPLVVALTVCLWRLGCAVAHAAPRTAESARALHPSRAFSAMNGQPSRSANDSTSFAIGEADSPQGTQW